MVADDLPVLLADPGDRSEPARRQDRAAGPAQIAGGTVAALAESGGLGAVPADPHAPVQAGLPSTFATGEAVLFDRQRAPSSSAVLWQARLRPVPPARDDARSSLARRLNQFNDSLSAARAASRASGDWTVESGTGDRSGLSPGALHGRDRVLRVVITMGDSTSDVFRPSHLRRDEWSARAQLWHEIQQQVRRTEVTAIFNERVKQIRERKNSESRGGSGGLGSRTVMAL
ncbi:MAG: hypothetical protein ACRERX_20350 [Pseudomonas sp.]